MNDHPIVLFIGGPLHGAATESIPSQVIAFDWKEDDMIRGYTNPLQILLSNHQPDYVRVSSDAFAHTSLESEEDVRAKLDEIRAGVSETDEEPVEADARAEGYAAALTDIRNYIDRRLSEFN